MSNVKRVYVEKKTDFAVQAKICVMRSNITSVSGR